jgi:hypothetical protein
VTYYNKSPQYATEIRPVGGLLVYADVTKLMGVLSVYAKAPKNRARSLGRRAHALMSMPDKQCYWRATLIDLELEKPMVSDLVKEKIPAFYRTRKYIQDFTRCQHRTQSQGTWVQCTHSYAVSWRPILILSNHARLCLPNVVFPSVFSTNIVYCGWSQAFAAVWMRSSLFWDITQRLLVVTDILGQPVRPIIKSHVEECLTLLDS